MKSSRLLSAGLALFGLAALPLRSAPAAPRVVLISGEYEYSSTLTLPALRASLEKNLGFQAIYLQRTAGEHIPGLEAIDSADLVIGIIRRMTLPEEELRHFRRYLDSGRPLLGMRTMCHAFQNWREFDHEVLGGNYRTHYKLGAGPVMHVYGPAKNDPLLAGIPAQFATEGELYKVLPLAADTHLLVEGTEPGMDGPPEPTAWTHVFHGARIFFTTMGHPADFNNPAFMRLITHAIFWSMNRPEPEPFRALPPVGAFPVRTISLGEFVQITAATSFMMLDLRPASEFSAGHVKNAVCLDPSAADFAARVAALDRAGFYLIYGKDSAPSELAARLHDSGFPFVYLFPGGFDAWRAAGNPVARSP